MGAKLIIYSDGTSRSEVKLSLMQRLARNYLIPRAAGVIAKSELAAQRFRELGAGEKIHIVPHSTKLAPYLAVGAERRRSRVEAPLELLSVGRLIVRKGLRHLLNALAKLPRTERPVHLTIVGSGPEEPSLLAQSRKLGLQNVRFTGFRDQDALPEFYAAADVFVFPTLKDPFGLVLLEAAAAGLALISSEAAGATYELVEENVTGYQYRPQDESQLSTLIADLANSPSRVDDFGRAAFALASQRTPQDSARLYLGAAKAVVAK